MFNDADRLLKQSEPLLCLFIVRVVFNRYTSLALWNLSRSPMLSSSGRTVNYTTFATALVDTMKVDKFISLLLMFPLLTEAAHSGEYTLHC